MWDKILTKEIISPILIIIIAVLVYFLIKQIIMKAFRASKKYGVHKKSRTIINLIINIIKYIVIIVATLAVLSAWGVDTKALVASLGVVGVVAGLAMQDILKRLFGWFFNYCR